jgi:hypothetical protein
MKVLGLALVVVGIAALWIAVKAPADPLKAIQEAIGSMGASGRKPA